MVLLPAVAGVQAFAWADLRRASPLESVVARWADGVAWPTDGVLGAVAWRQATVVDSMELTRRLAEPSAARLRVRRGGGEAIVAVPWALWRALAHAVLGDDGELAAPRPPSLAERAVVAVAIADALVRAGVAGEVELGGEPPPWKRAALVELAVSAPVAAELLVAVPATLPPPELRPLTVLCATRGGRLPDVTVAVALTRGIASASTWGAVACGDVLVVGPPAAALVLGGGAIPVTVDPSRARVTVRAPYQRATLPPVVGAPMSDDLAHDLAIPLAIVAGDVQLSARALLELAPGQVLTLGRPLGGAVELRAGGRCLARGELVAVDGELGVRITELVDPPSAVVATSA